MLVMIEPRRYTPICEYVEAGHPEARMESSPSGGYVTFDEYMNMAREGVQLLYALRYALNQHNYGGDPDANHWANVAMMAIEKSKLSKTNDPNQSAAAIIAATEANHG
ncbi:MAG: hypothetical protein ACTS5I_13155 [Rhodanobacter sp.]